MSSRQALPNSRAATERQGVAGRRDSQEARADTSARPQGGTFTPDRGARQHTEAEQGSLIEWDRGPVSTRTRRRRADVPRGRPCVEGSGRPPSPFRTRAQHPGTPRPPRPRTPSEQPSSPMSVSRPAPSGSGQAESHPPQPSRAPADGTGSERSRPDGVRPSRWRRRPQHDDRLQRPPHGFANPPRWTRPARFWPRQSRGCR